MKKSITIAALISMLIASPVMAAMTCVDGNAAGLYKDGIYSSNRQTVRLYVTCTADNTPGTMVDDMPANAQAVLDNGWYVYTFGIVPGATGPTDNSDLQILDGDDLTVLSAAGNGADVIDNATTTAVIRGDSAAGTEHLPLADGSPWEITVTNNAVNASSFTLIIQAPRNGGDNR